MKALFKSFIEFKKRLFIAIYGIKIYTFGRVLILIVSGKIKNG